MEEAMPAFRLRLKLFALFIFILLALLLVFSSDIAALRTLAGSLSETPQAADQTDFFEKQVRPILVRHCAACHNAKAGIAGLDLSSAEGFQRGGESGPLIDREHLRESRLLKVIGYQEKLKMPPAGKLKDEEIATLTAWISVGAPWPNTKTQAAIVSEAKATNRSSARGFSEAEKKFWAFQPISHPELPVVRNRSWVKTPVDAFILKKLEEKELVPAEPADKLTLLRRAAYDLTGLPPSETEIREYLADNSPEAFKKVVERLLASPRYGEKWGRHWLDVARYADSTGNDEDHRYPYAWKYRDYVIETFNKDLPYDQFVREQIAGDLIEPENSPGVNRRGIIATGFIALGPKAIAQQDKKKMLYDVYDEQVDVTTRAFLGLTVACARCHNHKFDPILTKDYYSMVGIFASTRSFSDPLAFVSQSLYKPLVAKQEYDLYLARKKAHEVEVKRWQDEMSGIVDHAKDKLIAEQAERLAEFMSAAHSVYHEKKDLRAVAGQRQLDEGLLKKWVDYLQPGKVKQHLLEWHNSPPDELARVAGDYQKRFLARLAEWKVEEGKWRASYEEAARGGKELPSRPEFTAGKDRFFHEVYFGKGPFSVTPEDQTRFSADQAQRLSEIKKELAELKKKAPPEPEMACAVEDGEITNQKVFIRGDYHNEGEDAPKGFPLILSAHTKQPLIKSGSGRLQLAEWIIQPEHPLTARVMVNRIWQWHFGEGLVRTPDNFGKMGEQPTHPQLLDFLARKFIESGWSIKAMHRLIMLSSAYQMSCEGSDRSFHADPENRLLSRFNRRRLSVEELRDGLLAIDASLDLTIGGTLQSGTGTDGENDNMRLSLNPEKLNRRTVYLPLRRANLPTLLNLFDFGDATTGAGKRQLTNVATQALFWMNSEFLTERSKNFSRSLIEQKGLSDDDGIKLAYICILNREATKEEVLQGLDYLSKFKQQYSKDKLDAWQSFCRVLMSSNDFIYVD
jgi:cytochrome c553